MADDNEHENIVEGILLNKEQYCGKQEKIVDHYLISWTIDEFLKISELDEKCVVSPPFQIHSEWWNMSVYPEFLNPNEKVIKFCLNRSGAGNKFCLAMVTYRFGIEILTNTWFEERRKISFTLKSSDSIVCRIPDYFESIDELKVNKVKIVCEMYITYTGGEQIIPISEVREAEDMRNLSAELLDLCEKSHEYDVLIRRKNFPDIPAHKAILSARSPVFSELVKNLPTPSSIDISEEDSNHIRNILTYIYSGRFYWIDVPGICIGLYECAQRYQLKGLIQLLTPSKIHIKSVVKESNINFIWTIENFSKLNLKLDECITSVPFHAGIRNSPIWYLDIYPDGSSGSLNAIGIYIRTENFKVIPNVKLCVSILDELNNEHGKKHTTKPLYPGFVYGFPDFITKEELINKNLILKDRLIVNCEICVRVVLHSFEEIDIISRSSCFRYPCLEELSADLKKLFESGDFSDVTLKGDSSVFKVHKIMSTRSSMLDLLFKTADKGKNVIEMKDFSDTLLDAFITYVYTGKWTDSAKHLAIEMYDKAKQYNMISLANSSSSVLTESLNSKCICDVILLAKRYNENLLMLKCLHYIKKNKEVLNSLEWKTLSSQQTGLTLKIEEWLEKPMNEIPDL